MKLRPTENKTKLVKLLRYKGYDVPSIHSVCFEKKARHTFLLTWVDSQTRTRSAIYAGGIWPKYLHVGGETICLTMAEVISFGLVAEK